jgi:hypothetical protein
VTARAIDAATYAPGVAVAEPPLPYTVRVLLDAVREAYPGSTATAHSGPSAAAVVLTVQTKHGRVTARAEASTLSSACIALKPWTVTP